MRPRRRAAAGAARGTDLLSTLPHAVVLQIFARLPPHTRLLCAAVCRAWRATAADGSLWTRLDLRGSAAAALTFPHDPTLPLGVTNALLRAATARAAPFGGLQSLDVRGCSHITDAALLGVVTASAAALQTVCWGGARLEADKSLDDIQALLGAAPALRELDVCAPVECTPPEASRLLRGEPPFGAVRVRRLIVNCLDEFEESESEDDSESESDDEHPVLHTVAALLADVAAARTAPYSLEMIFLRLGQPAALHAVVDAALHHRFSALCFNDCRLVAASAPALTRLLSAGSLTQLGIVGFQQALERPLALALAAALRANTTLTSLTLGVQLWDDMVAATALLDALRAHPSLRCLSVKENVAGVHAATAGAALAALIAANSPALRTLDASWCELGDEGMRAIAEALPANTHLRTLDVSYNGMTPAFAATRFMTAVRANASLRNLDMADAGTIDDAVLAHEQEVHNRRLFADSDEEPDSESEEWND
jgi:hypothetical protein